MDKKTFIDELSKRFVYMEDVIETVYLSLTKKEHCILYGPGGHAKSDIVEAGLTLLLGEADFYKETYIESCSDDMDTSPVMGYDNIPKYQSEGILEKVLTETIFLKKRYAILEEGLDAPGQLITALKDPLMRGAVCIGGGCYKNKLESLFICTNVDPRVWAGEDRSRLALLQRFYFSIEVKWPAYTAKEFNAMFSCRGMANMIVSKMAEICHVNGYKVSPRSAGRMNGLYTEFGVTSLKHFENMPPVVYQKLVEFEKSIPYIKAIQDFGDRLKALTNADDYREKLSGATILMSDIRKLKSVPTDGTYTEELRRIVTTAKLLQEEAIFAGRQPVNKIKL